MSKKDAASMIKTRLKTDYVIALGVFLAAFLLYLGTGAREILFGDPGEYTFVPATFSVAHPPGYAFYTLLAGIWQRVIPFETVAARTHALAAAAGAFGVTCVFAAVRQITPREWSGLRAQLPALAAAVGLAAATDFWQHASHANAHIITAALTALSLALLLTWQRTERDRYLWAFGVMAGVSVTHHPLAAFSFPAYTAFILALRPRILIAPRQLIKLVAAGLLGLTPWLYFPVRSLIEPPPVFGPHNMDTLDGFLSLITAAGLRVNLFHFPLAEQSHRLIVFASLILLQFSPIFIALAAGGFLGAWKLDRRRFLLLMAVFMAVNYAFIMNTVQDVMAYLMVLLVGTAVLAGMGVIGLLRLLSARWERVNVRALLILILIGPAVYAAARDAGAVRLADFTAAADYVDSIMAGDINGAVLLSDWEHLTPLWYAMWVEGRELPDIKLVYVASGTANPWVEHAWANIEEGPIYVTGYRPALIREGFRLRPVSRELYRLLPPPAAEPVQPEIPIGMKGGGVEMLGVDILNAPGDILKPGDTLELVLYLRAEAKIEHIIFPFARLGGWQYDFTTDGHHLSPWWEPGEIIGEVYELALPLEIAEGGGMALEIGLRDLNENAIVAEPVEVALFDVESGGRVPGGLLANIGQEVGLAGAWVRNGLTIRAAPWSDPVEAAAGDHVDVLLNWVCLQPIDESYTVFVHIIDGANRLIAQRDYTPLGGAFPTSLWIPKWLPGQSVLDPYTITIPAGTPPGDYAVEVGMYGMTDGKRIRMYDAAGNTAGDRYILGWLHVR